MSNEITTNLNIFTNKTLDDLLLKAMDSACVMVQQTAQQTCPIETGNLRRSINFSTETSGDGVTGVVYSNAEYAPYVEIGTGIYAPGGRTTPWRYYGS